MVSEREHCRLLQGGAWYQKCYDPECRQYRSQIMPLPPAIMQRLQADAASAALRHTAESQVQPSQPSAYGPPDGMAQGPLLPIAAHEGEACTESLDNGGMAYEHQQGNLNSIGVKARTMDDIISAHGTGVFIDNAADDVFDKELLRLFERCDRAADGT